MDTSSHPSGAPADDRTGPSPKQTRAVTVDEPGLSARTNAQLTEELRQVIGHTQVQVPVERPHASLGEPTPAEARGERLHPRSFLATMIGAAAIGLGAIIALLTDTWWLLPVSVIVLYGATYGVVRVVLRMLDAPERPSAATVAAMEEEGVRDPEHYFSALVDEFTEHRGAADLERRTTEAHEDTATAAAEHRSAMTPSGGPTRPVGPGQS